MLSLRRPCMTMQSFRHAITAQIPDDWLTKESITLYEQNWEANVIASYEPIEEGLTSKEYAESQGDPLRQEFPAYDEISFSPTELLGGRSGYLRKFEWTPPDGERVTQLQLYYAENGRGFTATATTSSVAFYKFERVLIDVLRNLSLSS
jgi:hypothetical protein